MKFYTRTIILFSLVCIIAPLALALAWYRSLPHLDPTGQEDSSTAMRAMVEGKAVLNTATRWPVTPTGWPFFDRYEPVEK